MTRSPLLPLAVLALLGACQSNGAAAAAKSPNASTAPIDCPLRAQGIDTAHLRPFQEVEDYIAFLDRPDRDGWQKPAAVVAALHLEGTETVADVGAGSGYFTFRLAAALPNGRVRAIDVEPEMLRHIHHAAVERGIENVDVVLAAPDDPKVAADTDLVFICDVLHHVEDPGAWLGRLHDELAPGARLVLIEFREGELPQGPPEAVKIPRARMIELMNAAGFERVEDHAQLLDYQQFLVFERD